MTDFNYGINPSLMKTQGQPMTFGLDNITGTSNINTGQNDSFMSNNFSLPDTMNINSDIMSNIGNPGGTGTAQQGSFMDGFFMNEQGGPGVGISALQAATGLANTFMGFKQLGVAKDQLAFTKSAWQKQFDIQKEQYDRQVKERAQRVANNKASASSAYSGG